jgi:MraZ protein
LQPFLGRFESTLDDKGRIVLPAKLRKAAGADGLKGYVVSPSFDRCIEIRTEKRFNEWLNSLVDEPSSMDPDVRDWMKDVVAESDAFTCDKQGRLPLPAELVSDVGIAKDVKVVGMGDCIQVWDRDAWLADTARRRPTRKERHIRVFAQSKQRRERRQAGRADGSALPPDELPDDDLSDDGLAEAEPNDE